MIGTINIYRKFSVFSIYWVQYIENLAFFRYIGYNTTEEVKPCSIPIFLSTCPYFRLP